ncbi:hypothetical protein HDR60_02975 [bacterium]|nr:hypothetical protein [bacterium]
MEKIKVQIIEDETLQGFADFNNAEVWLLSDRGSSIPFDERLVVVPELTNSDLPSNIKIPVLMTEIYEKHPNNVVKETVTVPKLDSELRPVLDENGKTLQEEKELELSEMSFEYEVLTRKKENFAMHTYVCDESCIKVVE